MGHDWLSHKVNSGRSTRRNTGGKRHGELKERKNVSNLRRMRSQESSGKR